MNQREYSEIIKKMNKHMGTNHRSTPYDFMSEADLRQALTLAVGAYCDYSEYAGVLYKLIEDFDESLEHYDTETWLNLGRSIEDADDLSVKCLSDLHYSLDSFQKIADKAKERLIWIIKVIITAPDDIQIKVLGSSFYFNPNEIEDKMESLFIALDESHYYYSIPESFNNFLVVLKNTWVEKSA